jgi:hypothetical protein
VVTDGSNHYPESLGQLCPEADHHLCIFHVLKTVNSLILDAIRRRKVAKARRGQV